MCVCVDVDLSVLSCTCVFVAAFVVLTPKRNLGVNHVLFKLSLFVGMFLCFLCYKLEI